MRPDLTWAYFHMPHSYNNFPGFSIQEPSGSTLRAAFVLEKGFCHSSGHLPDALRALHVIQKTSLGPRPPEVFGSRSTYYA